MSATMTGAEAAIALLEHAGIEVVFGIPGKYNMPLYDAVRRSGSLRAFSVRHEQGAAFAADGYARATGRPAALLLLPGCGVTNAMTALGEAYWDSSPVLVIATEVSSEYIGAGHGLLHELPGQFEVLDTVTKFSERVTDPASLPGAFSRAFGALFGGRPRPVQVEVPLDVQTEPVKLDTLPDLAGRSVVPSGAEISRAARLLGRAERPLLYAGGGVVSGEAGRELVELAELLQAPVITTGMGAGSIPGDHPLSCGVAWEAATDMRPLIRTSDAFLAVGTRFNEGMTYGWEMPVPATSIRIDIDPGEHARTPVPVSLSLLGDARSTLRALLDALAPMERRVRPAPEMAVRMDHLRRDHRRKLGRTAPWMDALRSAMPRETIVAADMSLFWADMIGCFPFYEPRTSLFPWGYGTLGFGVPAAIGAKLGCPDRPVAAVVGDGAMLFTGAELATAVQYHLNIPFVVANNNSYGMIRMQQEERFGARVGVDLVNPDFVAYARSFGALGDRVDTPDGLGISLQKALAAELPTVIEVPWGVTFDGAPVR